MSRPPALLPTKHKTRKMVNSVKRRFSSTKMQRFLDGPGNRPDHRPADLRVHLPGDRPDRLGDIGRLCNRPCGGRRRRQGAALPSRSRRGDRGLFCRVRLGRASATNRNAAGTNRTGVEGRNRNDSRVHDDRSLACIVGSCRHSVRGPINAAPDLFENAHIVERNIIVSVDDPAAGRMRLAGLAIKMSTCADRTSRPPMRRLDEHGDRLRAECDEASG